MDILQKLGSCVGLSSYIEDALKNKLTKEDSHGQHIMKVAPLTRDHQVTIEKGIRDIQLMKRP